jgi:hypothetical protein
VTGQNRRVKVAILVPVYRDVKAGFAVSLANLVSYTTRASIRYEGRIVQPVIETTFADNGPLDAKRIILADLALAATVDYILWLDSDHTFAPDALLRLLRHDLPIVGYNYARRLPPYQATALDLAGEPIVGEGLLEVGAVGLGFCLTKSAIFAKIERPWFNTKIADDGSVITGEDVHFCNRARSAGFQVFADNDPVIWHIEDRALTLRQEGSDACSVQPSRRTQ